MRVIVMVCHGAGATRRHAGHRRFLKAPSRRQMTMGFTRFQQTGIGDTGRHREYPGQQHQASGVAFGKGAGKKFHGDMREEWFILSSTREGLLIFVKRAAWKSTVTRACSQPQPCYGHKGAFALSRPRGTAWV